MGLGGSSISGMKYSLPRIIYGLTRQLYIEDRDHYFKSLHDFNEIEFNIELNTEFNDEDCRKRLHDYVLKNEHAEQKNLI